MTATSSVTDPVLAGWRSLSCGTVIRGDFKSPNEWSYSYVDSRAGMGANSFYANKKWYSTTFGIVGAEIEAYADISTLTSAARKIALGRLNEKTRGNLDLAVSIAEGGQTIKMLNLTRRFVDAMASMRRTFLTKVWRSFYARRNAKSLERALKRWQNGIKSQSRFARKYYRSTRIEPGLVQRVSAAGANGWLEFTYGWMPLKQDIYGLATQTIGRVRNAIQRFKAKGSVQINEGRKEAATVNSPPRKLQATGAVKVTIGCKMLDSFDPTLSRFTSLNPLSVGYELTPLSFVLDWFVDFGSYLRNMETALLFRRAFQYGYESVLAVVNYVGQTSGKSLGSNSWYTESTVATKRVVTFNRSLIVSYPSPSVPKLNLDLGSSQMLSAASLLRQLIR